MPEKKVREQMPQAVKYAYLAMVAITVATCVLPVPVYVHMITLAMCTIYIGSYNSLLKEAQEEGEQMETADVYMFPFIASGVLFSLYCVFKFLPKAYINMVVKAYFFVFGILALGKRFAQLLGVLLPAATADNLDEKSYSFKFPAMPEVPMINPKIEGETPEEAEAKRTVEFTNLGLVGLGLSSFVGVINLVFNSWITLNTFGVAFSIAGIESLGLGSYFNGLVLLSLLFFYDIFWVFGTDVMVTVAKNFDAPIKLLFPYGGEGKQSMLGLGDIVIPGIFIALMLRFDLAQQKKSGADVDPTYFKWVMVSYGLGLTTTVLVMYAFEAAQPALLYLVPACLGSTLLLALSRGDIKELMAYTEEIPEEKKEETQKDK